ncbi:MAG TPA: EscV/YscV/HrcV family type III secretion system export apparatus protein, partial [Spirochaetia bacterium]|nr:EscV/YscV/HrcV family type III secretion system export apparatus protein [Spirochaetia bacterium]
LGLIVPQIRITDNLKLQPDEYQIKINGVPVGKYRLRPSKYLAMNTSGIETELEGEKTMEPAFGLPAVWIDDEYREKAEKKGFTVVDNPSVIATHLTELIKRNAHEILGRQEVKQIIDNVRKNNQALVDELKDKGISVGYVQKVLQQLLLEGISIRNIVRILELVADFGPGAKNIELLTEHVRSGLNRQICEMFADEARNIHAAICSTELESELLEAVVETDSGNVLNLGPDALKTLIDNIGRAFREMRDKGFSEILLVEPNLRSALRKVLQRSYQQAAIISAGEIAPDYNIDIIRVV